jgi:excisionase family DNA binding protein
MTEHHPEPLSSNDLLPAQADPVTPKWLTLSEAAGFLGIHFSTLRAWADKGEIRVFRTPGGHRRFSVADLRRFLDDRASSTELANVDTMMEAALVKVRAEMHSMPEDRSAWRSTLTEQDRQNSRERGRHLFSLALSFVLKPSQRVRLLEDGRQVGQEYGHEAARMGISLAETGRAVQFFRTQLLEAVRDGDTYSPLDAEDVRIQKVIDQFLNEILYAVLDGYEGEMRTSPDTAVI